MVARPGLDVEKIPELIATIQTADVSTLQRCLGSCLLDPIRGDISHIALRAIDPVTGDSLLHCAAVAGDMPAMEALRNFARGTRNEQLVWVSISHEINTGETALHAAARAGKERGAAAVYRAFHGMGLEEEDPDDPVGWVSEIQHNNFPRHEPQLSFRVVCTTNKNGQCAAGVARQAGFEDLA